MGELSETERRQFEEMVSANADVFASTPAMVVADVTRTRRRGPRWWARLRYTLRTGDTSVLRRRRAGSPIVLNPDLARATPRARVRTVGQVLLALVVVGLLITFIVGMPQLFGGRDTPSAEVPAAATNDARPLPAVPVTTQGQYGFLGTLPDGSPVTWDPCQPIHFTINPEGAPLGGVGSVRAAFADVSTRTGLQFVEDAQTDERVVVSATSRHAQQDRYGDGWAPVLVMWNNAAHDPGLDGRTAGYAQPIPFSTVGPDSTRYVSGAIVLDSQDLAGYASDPRGSLYSQLVAMHEIGHLVGLDHVGDDSQLMATTARYQTSWGDGDLAGLALAGASQCLPTD